jgi:hypothetical protein
MPNTNRVIVRRQSELGSRQYGVYLNGRLIEGGFFSKAAAEACAARHAGNADTFGREPMADTLDY